MAAISTRQPAIVITYVTAKGRRGKKFSGEQLAEARGFWAKKLEAGADPEIRGQKPANWDAPAVTDPETEELNTAVEVAQAGDVGPAVLSVAKPQGVNPNATTRALVAGRVLARHGHAAGVTEAMVAEVDAEFGRANKVESEIHLRNAFHAIKGYLETLGMPIPEVAQ